MSRLIHLKKQDQELMPLFNGAFIENKPIPFPNSKGTTAYSNLFYWAHLEAKETAEFPLHPHEGFEIMTFIFKGSLEHFDTATKVWTALDKGGMQVIQTGSGVKHAERITKGTELFQIWFDPDFSKSMLKDARYKDYPESTFETQTHKGKKSTFYIGNNSSIYCETMGIEITKISYKVGMYEESHDKDFTYSYYLLAGKMKVNGSLLEKDGFLVENDNKDIQLEVLKKSDVFLVKSPSKVDYKRFIQRY
ncbi:MAG: hypothetical protein COA44_14815 [Arcobacter sp.]|nr:MAG: hypothetical protein COA44_14815 [Arcobacter sp.]